MVAFFIIFGAVVGLGLVAWVLIRTFVPEQREPKGKQ
jgi:predicted MFS family arabinose efflux permease